jgi:TrmH family RNA methyltransferase
MLVIESAQNPQVKLLQSLATAKGRQEHGLFLVEGAHAVAELIATGWTPEIGCVCPALLANEDLAMRLEATSRTFLEMSERAFKAISDTVTPQGVAAAVRVPRGRVRDLPPGAGVFLVVHEGRDPGNMGTMIRTADAAGAAGVIAVDDCVDFFSPKVVRATAGSLFHVGLAACTSAEFLTWAAETGTALLATHLHARQTPAEVTFPERVALLIGSEAHGLPEALLTASDIQVTIPMPGRAESLNAAVAAGILLYETIRQR